MLSGFSRNHDFGQALLKSVDSALLANLVQYFSPPSTLPKTNPNNNNKKQLTKPPLNLLESREALQFWSMGGRRQKEVVGRREVQGGAACSSEQSNHPHPRATEHVQSICYGEHTAHS